MKTRVFPYLLPFCVFFLFGCGPTASRGPTDAITFDTAKRLDDFDFASSDGGRLGDRWLDPSCPLRARSEHPIVRR